MKHAIWKLLKRIRLDADFEGISSPLIYHQKSYLINEHRAVILDHRGVCELDI